MREKWDAFMGRAGFITTLAICLLVAGVSAYFLLADREKPAETEPLAGTETVMDETRLPGEPRLDVSAAQPIVMPEEKEEPEEQEEQPETESVSAAPTTSVPTAKPVAAEAPRLVVAPLRGEVLAAFSADALVYNAVLADWRTHEGVDIAAKPGAAVQASCAGTVAVVENDPLMGTTVVIDHGDGYHATYANLQARPTVEAGDDVTAGQVIGAVGTTAAAESALGPHLHFSVEKDGDTVDPNRYLTR